MSLPNVFDYSLPARRQGKEQLQVRQDGNMYLLCYYDTHIIMYNVYDGSIWKHLETEDSIVKVIDCSFHHYGNCLCALLHNSCVIWNEAGEVFFVALPCRMKSVYALKDGVVFERVDDLFSMNTSFTVTSSIQCIPMYFSLTSPLSIPKPVVTYQDGMNVTNESYLNVSTSLSMFDVFNSYLDFDRNEQENPIVSVIPSYSLIVCFSRNTEKCSILRYTPIEKKDLEEMNHSLRQPDFLLSDQFISSLNNPDFILSTVYCGDEMNHLYQSVTCVESINQTHVFLYCSTNDFTDCFRCTVDSLKNAPSIQLDYMNCIQGRTSGILRTDSLFLQHSILCYDSSQWSIVMDAHILRSGSFPGTMGKEVYVMNDGLIGLDETFIHIAPLISEWSEKEDCLLMLLSRFMDNEQLLEIVCTTRITLLELVNQLDSAVVRYCLCLMLDHYWIEHDLQGIDELLNILDPDHSNFMFDCYWKEVTPNWYSRIYLHYHPDLQWIPYPFLLHYKYTFHSLTPFNQILSLYDRVKDVLPNLSLLQSSHHQPPLSPLTYHSTPLLPLSPSSHTNSPLSPLLKEVTSLLQNKVVNLHLPSDSTLTDVQKLIQVKVETQLLAISGYSILTLPPPSSQPKENSVIQVLHKTSFHLTTAGRRNNECDLTDCEFTSSFLTKSWIHSTIQKAVGIIATHKKPSIFTLDDMTFILYEKTEEEQVGLLIALGVAGLLRKVRLNLYKLKLRFYQSIQWRDKDPQKSRSTEQINYKVEIGYILGISLAYQGSNENELIQVLESCINSIMSLRQAESSQENTILFEWKSGNDDSVMELLCCCIVSLGLVCHSTQNLRVIDYLIALQSTILAHNSFHLMEYTLSLAVAIGLICINDSPSPSLLNQQLSNHLTILLHRLTTPNTPTKNSHYLTGKTCPVEMISGTLLQIGFISLSCPQLSLHPLFGNGSPESLFEFITVNRSDNCFFYGVSFALSQYSILTLSFQSLLQYIPSSYHSSFDSLPLPVKKETHPEYYYNLMCFLGGVIYITSIKFAGQVNPDLIQDVINRINHEDTSIPAGISIPSFIVSFLYHLIVLDHLPFLCSPYEGVSLLVVYPHGFVLSLLQSLGLFFQGSENETVVILLRHILQASTERKITGVPEDGNGNDVIEVCGIALGLITAGYSSLTFSPSMKNMVFKLVSLLPCYCTLLNDPGVMPSMFRQLIRCCETLEKKELVEEKKRVNPLMIPFSSRCVDLFYKGSEWREIRGKTVSVPYNQQLELVALQHS